MFEVKPKTVPKNEAAESDSRGTFACSGSGIAVAGVREMLADLRATYPDLTDESLERILGLPRKEDLGGEVVLSDQRDQGGEE